MVQSTHSVNLLKTLTRRSESTTVWTFCIMGTLSMTLFSRMNVRWRLNGTLTGPFTKLANNVRWRPTKTTPQGKVLFFNPSLTRHVHPFPYLDLPGHVDNNNKMAARMLMRVKRILQFRACAYNLTCLHFYRLMYGLVFPRKVQQTFAFSKEIWIVWCIRTSSLVSCCLLSTESTPQVIVSCKITTQNTRVDQLWLGLEQMESTGGELHLNLL